MTQLTADLPQQDLMARARAMPWKQMVDLLKATVRRHSQATELPTLVAEWFDLNRDADGDDDACEIAKAEMLVKRMDQAAMISPAAFKAFAEDCERAPVGPVWWVAVSWYLRAGRRWWLLRTWLEGNADVESITNDQRKGLAKIVGRFGGNAKRPLLSTGDQLFFTWPD